VGQGPVGPVGEDLLGPGVAAVLLFGLEQGERGVGEDRVVAPGRNSSPCPAAARTLGSIRTVTGKHAPARRAARQAGAPASTFSPRTSRACPRSW